MFFYLLFFRSRFSKNTPLVNSNIIKHIRYKKNEITVEDHINKLFLI